ncbi:MAG: thermonuclease family protein [Deltaproteobacteria bacterium]|nr:MAG: thermonuclease family protein [Deltaproteobacteria bacterium]
MEEKMFKYNAMVTRIVDGDTVVVAVDLGFRIVRTIKIRFAGIDSYELKDKKNLEKALAAKKYLEETILNKEIMLKSLKPGKYHDRYIAFLYLDNSKKSVNDIMIEKGLVNPYTNKKRVIKKNENTSGN